MSEEFVTPLGSRTKKIYSPKVNDDGSIDLYETGKEDWYGYIQSFKDSVDIHVILSKCANGDMSALSAVQGFYGDVKQFPKTKPEMLQLMIDAQRNFEKLPLDVRKEFDYDVNKFIATMDTPEWFEKMKFKLKEEKPIVDQEVGDKE